MKTIHLLTPFDGSRTPPLQTHAWPSASGADEDLPRPALWSDSVVDRGLPRPVLFAWESAGTSEDHRRFDLLLSRHPDLTDAQAWKGLARPQAELLHLLLDTRYYWKVVELRQGRQTAESRVWTFRTHAEPPRWIQVPGITNVRDVGGWRLLGGGRVRQGLIYRSSEMNNHTELTPVGARVLVEELGIRTDLDLRGVWEEPHPALDPAQVEWINVPIDAYTQIASPLYREGFRRVFHVLADPALYPILVHCWGGADRAGTVVLLLNALLGVGLEDLIRDYELTSLSRSGERLRTMPEFQAFLALLSEYGGPGASLREQAGAYLRSVGVTMAEIAALREQLAQPN